jgi:hydrogenase-4 component F
MHALSALALVAPLIAAITVAVTGWRPIGIAATVIAPALALGCALALSGTVTDSPVHTGPLRADSLAVVMLVVIGSVGLLATVASISYLRHELDAGEVSIRRARSYGVLINLFIAAMTLAVLADNLGVMWVAIEATTIVTAFLVGHRDTRAALEATWKYVIICSVGIALAFLGTVLLYFVSVHAGPTHDALGFESLVRRAPQLDHGVTRVAAVLLLLGYGTKVGLAPFHTWLADAHSQAPAPISALMSGVLLSVALSCLLRVKAVIDLAVGSDFMRDGLLTLGLLTLLIAAGLMVGQRDYKRLLAYSSAEQMAFAAVAATGDALAISALLLLFVVHGLAKSVLFVGSGRLQHAYRSTSIAAVGGVLRRGPGLGIAFIAGLCVLAGLPPFGLFASEVGIARGLSRAGLAWPLGLALLLMLIAVAALARHGGAMLLGEPEPNAPELRLGRLDATVIAAGLTASLALGVATGPLTPVLTSAARLLAGAG